MISFNINENVRVRLNARGVAILKADHDELAALYPSIGPFTPPKVDADGWSEFQLWSLMRDFGPHINLGFDPPFDTTIEFKPPATHPSSRGE